MTLLTRSLYIAILPIFLCFTHVGSAANLGVTTKMYNAAKDMILNNEKQMHSACASAIMERRELPKELLSSKSENNVPSAGNKVIYEEWKISRCKKLVLYEVQYTIKYHNTHIVVRPISI